MVVVGAIDVVVVVLVVVVGEGVGFEDEGADGGSGAVAVDEVAWEALDFFAPILLMRVKVGLGHLRLRCWSLKEGAEIRLMKASLTPPFSTKL